MDAKYINSNSNRSSVQNVNMFFGLRQKGLLQVRTSIFHNHFLKFKFNSNLNRPKTKMEICISL